MQIDLEMDQEHWIYLDEQKKEGVSVTLLDAFHCPGAIMYLFRGKMGNVLHTGDFRFSEQMFDNACLFPPEKRTKDMRQISIDIDYLFLDNTFANPEYDFPSREEAYKGLVDIVRNHDQYRIYVFSYYLGKEEVFLNLAKEFETLVKIQYLCNLVQIVVDEDRYRKIQLMDLSPELFTTDPSQGWIHIKSIKDLKALEQFQTFKTFVNSIEKCNCEEPTIFIILTGWNDKYNRNLPFYFKVPYSSHSNYRELERFVKAICPKNLIFNVSDREVTKKRLEFQQYLCKEYVKRDTNAQIEQFNPQKGYLVNNYQNLQKSTSKEEEQKEASGYQNKQNLSERFNNNNVELNKRRFQEQNAHIFKARNGAKKGKPKGAKFQRDEISFSLTPQKEDFEEAFKKQELKEMNELLHFDDTDKDEKLEILAQQLFQVEEQEEDELEVDLERNQELEPEAKRQKIAEDQQHLSQPQEYQNMRVKYLNSGLIENLRQKYREQKLNLEKYKKHSNICIDN